MGRNAWNNFQRAHAGQGYSRQEMSAMYQEAKSGGNVYTPSYTSSYAPSYAYSSSYAAPCAPTYTAPARVAPAPTSAWNAFRQAYAGLGLSIQDVSALYQASKTAFPSSAAPSWTRPHASTPMPSGSCGIPQSDHQSSPGTQGQHKAEVERQAQHAEGSATSPSSTASRRSTWSEFQRQHAGKGLTKVRMWLLFIEERKLGASKGLSSSRASGVTTSESQNESKFVATDEAIELSRLELAMDEAHRIGSGAFGIVYAGLLDNILPVAVKVVDGVSATSKTRFKQEFRAIMRASQHENVLRVHGYVALTNPNGHQSYGIVMELMGGGDLALAIHSDDSDTLLKEIDRLNLLLQVIKSIECLHAQGITHRDIKPQNVLLSSDYKTAKLADFGLAGVKSTTLTTRQSPMATGDGTSNGAHAVGLTPAYAAPEVIEGKLSFRDTAWKKSDIFSFTVLMTHLLTGEQPWDLETPQFVMNAVSQQQRRPFDAERIVFARDEVATNKIRSLVRNGWQQDPEVRPTATEMRERLEQVIAARENTRSREQTKPPPPSSPRSVDDSDEFFDAIFASISSDS